jgi:hypothetical protein
MTVAVDLNEGRTLWEALGEIPDRRGWKGRQYPLSSVIGLALAAMIAGADDLMAIFRWGRRLPPEALRLFGLTQARATRPCEDIGIAEPTAPRHGGDRSHWGPHMDLHDRFDPLFIGRYSVRDDQFRASLAKARGPLRHRTRR